MRVLNLHVIYGFVVSRGMVEDGYSLFGHSPEICSTIGPEKIVVGRVLSFWDAPFSGAMLNFRGVVGNKSHK